jgi:Bacterial regulatory proteins, gntR family
MITHGRETAEVIAWQLNGLLADSHTLPPGLAAALRAYMAELLRQCAAQAWARPGHRSRYGRLADTIGRHIADGIWQPGERMPAVDYLATTYYEKEKTVERALFVLTIRGQLAQERLTYYALPSV